MNNFKQKKAKNSFKFTNKKSLERYLMKSSKQVHFLITFYTKFPYARIVFISIYC